MFAENGCYVCVPACVCVCVCAHLQGSILEDGCCVTFCNFCAMLQMHRELKICGDRL